MFHRSEFIASFCPLGKIPTYPNSDKVRRSAQCCRPVPPAGRFSRWKSFIANAYTKFRTRFAILSIKAHTSVCIVGRVYNSNKFLLKLSNKRAARIACAYFEFPLFFDYI